MRYVPPFGSSDQNAGYVNGTPSSKGSVIPAEAIEFPQREIINAITTLGLVPSANDNAQLAKAISTMSFRYSSSIDYDKPRPVIGSDDLFYIWKRANGPSTTIMDPVNDTNETYWIKYNPSPEIPTTSDEDAGLVKLSDSIESSLDASTGETAASPYAVKQLHDIILTMELVFAQFQNQLITESDYLTKYQINTNTVLNYLLSRVNNINAGTTLITTPSITSPSSNTEVAQGNPVSLTSSAFNCAITASHYASDWKICTDEYGYATLATVTESTTDKTSITFAASIFSSLEETTKVYAFVRYKDESLGYSYWSTGLPISITVPEDSE